MTPGCLRPLRGIASLLALAVPAAPAGEPLTSIEVRFKLVDAAGQPVRETPVRLTLAWGNGWQAPSSGTQVLTNAAGQATLLAWATPEPRSRKVPSNFFTQTASAPQPTVHFSIGAELTFLGRPWLVVASADRFPDGTSAQLEGMKIYGRDETGTFSLPARQLAAGWQLPGIHGMLTTPGFQVGRFTITPDAGGWIVDLWVQREGEPIAR